MAHIAVTRHLALLTSAVAVLVMTSACSGGDKPEGFQKMCDHIEAAQSAVQDEDFAKARDEIVTAYDWSEAAVEDTEGADRQAVEAIFRSLEIARGDPSADAPARALADAAEKCS
jgi:hypothetical protein